MVMRVDLYTMFYFLLNIKKIDIFFTYKKIKYSNFYLFNRSCIINYKNLSFLYLLISLKYFISINYTINHFIFYSYKNIK